MPMFRRFNVVKGEVQVESEQRVFSLQLLSTVFGDA